MRHLVSSAYIELLLRSQWLPAEQLCEGSKFDPARLSELEYIDAEDAAIIFINLDRFLDLPGWPVELGNRFGLTTHGPLGFAALSAPTLGAAMQAFVDFHAVRVTGLEMQLMVETDRAMLTVVDIVSPPAAANRMEQLVLKIVESLIETLLGHAVGSNVSISFAMSAPRDANVLSDAFHSQLIFGAQQTAISLPSAWLHLPSPLHDENNFRLHSRQCRDIINRIMDPADVVGKIHRLLDNHFDRAMAFDTEMPPAPGIDDIAGHLNMSTRTVIRHLKHHNLSYRQLLENKRKDVSRQLLARPSLSITDIAYRLGYQEAANFTRAFKTWFGESPREWRQQL